MLYKLTRPLKRLIVVSVILLCAFVFTATAGFAQPRMQGGAGGQSMNCPECSHHEADCGEAGDPSCCSQGANLGAVNASRDSEASAGLITLQGEVIDVYQMTSKQGHRSGTHLLLQANGETLEIRLGPSSYLEAQHFNIEPNDFLEIEGTQTRKAGQPAVIAIKVTKGDQVLVLRDQQGLPLWRPSPQS